MKRVQYHRYGGPEVLRLEEFEPAAPSARQVLVGVRAAAANPMDWNIRNGEMRLMTGSSFPRGVGNDFAGVVEAVGPAVTRLRPGDSVLGATSLRSPGAFAEMVLANERAVVQKPAELSFDQASTLPVVGVTALQALQRAGRLQPGQTVFVHGCLGGVGRVAVQLARRRGASVTGSCRTGVGIPRRGHRGRPRRRVRLRPRTPCRSLRRRPRHRRLPPDQDGPIPGQARRPDHRHRPQCAEARAERAAGRLLGLHGPA